MIKKGRLDGSRLNELKWDLCSQFLRKRKLGKRREKKKKKRKNKQKQIMLIHW